MVHPALSASSVATLLQYPCSALRSAAELHQPTANVLLPAAMPVNPTADAAAAAPADISGSVPASLAQLNRLKLLDLEFNFLAGGLAPATLCPAGNVLQAVYLRANNFTGSLNLTACRRLEVADIQVRLQLHQL
jgi:hypothetical protein